MTHRIYLSTGAYRISGLIRIALGLAALFFASAAAHAQTTPVERHGQVSSTGGWSTGDLTASGNLVREELRAKNPSPEPK